MTSPASFVHLHLHSEFSLIDSTVRIEELVAATAAAGMPAVAITDAANLFALVKFYRAAEKAGIKPLVGCDLRVADARGKIGEVTLLCRDNQGYRQLTRLLTLGYRRRQPGRPIVLTQDEVLAAGPGLAALLGPRSRVIQEALAARDAAAGEQMREWQDAFGDYLFLELVRCGREQEEDAVAAALDLARRHEASVVATNDVRFLEPDDFEAHEARVCIHHGEFLSDAKRVRRYTSEQYLRSPDEMAARFADLPIALDNAVELARCLNLELDFGRYYLPASPTPPGRSENQHLRDEAEAGLTRRLAEHGLAPAFERDAYAKRLDLELGVIESMGFAGYFLIVAEFIGWARAQNIPVGPGRGSGAGSLVAWSLAITDLDPLRFDLLFERFLNPERVSMPDFDIDFCMDQRDRVIEHVAELYGHDKVSQIITYGTMAAKAVLRDTGRVLGMSYGFVDRIAKSVPLRPLDVTLEDALGLSEDSRRQPERVSAELVALYRDEDDVRQLVDLARALEGLTRNAGKHAGGVVIAPTALTDFAPLYAEAEGDAMVTQFDKDDTEAVGLVKFDFLGLRTLTIIDWTVRVINEARVEGGTPLLDMAKLPLDDPQAYALLHRCQTTAVFQLESRGMKELVRKLRPDCFDDIVALVALFRPGPLQSGMVDDFIARKHGQANVSYPHPLVEPILAPTYGVIVYQEQVMQIAQVLAGYTLGGADLLRRAMGKKKADEMAKERVKFESGAALRGIEARVASAIFDLMEKFAEYGFNKSHSAAYAVLSYQTAWLKAHYPAEFMAAVLSSDMDHTDKVVNFLDDARALGLTVLPPNVASSAYRFRARDPRTIVYGLGAIKGVGEHACREIEREREMGGVFRDLADFCGRVDPARIGKRAMEALLNAGALDGLAPNRASLALQLPLATRAAEQALRDRDAGIVDMFGNCAAKPVAVDWPIAPEWPLAKRLTAERDVLGFYLSGHPLDAWRGVVELVTTSAIDRIATHWQAPPEDKKRFDRGALVRVAGQVAQLRRGGGRAFVQLADGSGRIEVSFFRDEFANAAPLLLKDALLLIEGHLHMDDFSGQLQIRGRHAEPLADACARQTRALKFSLAPDSARAGAAPGVRTATAAAEHVGGEAGRLARLLQPFTPGATRILVECRSANARAVLELGDRWRVRVTPALLAALADNPLIADVELIGATSPSPAAAAAA